MRRCDDDVLRRENGLCQLMSEVFDEVTVLRVAQAYEQATPGVINIEDHK